MNDRYPLGKTFALLQIIAFALMITANALANGLPLNGKTTGELSDQYPNYFTPAGLTFSIWGVIYLFLLGYIIYQATILYKGTEPETGKLYRVAPYIIANFLLNGSWIFAWHYEHVALSLLIIVGMLVTLIIIHNKLFLPFSWENLKDKLLIDVPFSIYLGWITIATIANATVLLTTLGWRGGSLTQDLWTKIIVATGTLICVLMLATKKNIFYSLVVIWAFYGIIVERSRAGTPTDQSIVQVVNICIGIIVAVLLFTLMGRSRKPSHGTSRQLV